MTNIVRTIILLTNFIKYNYEKMLVKVLHKETRQELLISPRAYELAKKRYTFIGHVEDNDANTTTPKAVAATPAPQATQAQTSEVDLSPNQKTTVTGQAGDGGKVAEAVVSNPQQEKKKPGRKAKSISSPAPTVEV